MRASIVLALGFSLGCSPVRNENPLVALGNGFPLNQNNFDAGDARSTYQIGSEWSKKTVSTKDFEALPGLETIARGTGTLGGGTGFYLGKFDGQHVVATNHHVCPAGFNCLGGRFSLPLSGRSFKLATFLGTWKSIDLTLLTIRPASAEDEKSLEEIANPFHFEERPFSGQTLITVGFGASNNPLRQLQASADRDCIVFSDEDEYRLMDDPDVVHPSSYQTWSFANGCDVSHGDSGSAFVDRDSGSVVGLLWTGKVPKKAEVRDSVYLGEIREKGSEDIWTELTYAVPVAKIREQLEADLLAGRLQEKSRAVIAELLDRSH